MVIVRLGAKHEVTDEQQKWSTFFGQVADAL